MRACVCVCARACVCIFHFSPPVSSLPLLSPSHPPRIHCTTFPLSPSTHPFLYLSLLTLPASLALPSTSHHPFIPFSTLPFSPSPIPFLYLPLLTIPSSLCLPSPFSHTPHPFRYLAPTPSFVSKAVGRGSGCCKIDDYLSERDGLVSDTGTHL